jgi:hypothetical protein
VDPGEKCAGSKEELHKDEARVVTHSYGLRVHPRHNVCVSGGHARQCCGAHWTKELIKIDDSTRGTVQGSNNRQTRFTPQGKLKHVCKHRITMNDHNILKRSLACAANCNALHVKKVHQLCFQLASSVM